MFCRVLTEIIVSSFVSHTYRNPIRNLFRINRVEKPESKNQSNALKGRGPLAWSFMRFRGPYALGNTYEKTGGRVGV